MPGYILLLFWITAGPTTTNVPSLREITAVQAAFSLYEPYVEHADMSISCFGKWAVLLVN